MAQQIPLVDYVVPRDNPHLVAHECTRCRACCFDRRNACASCESTDFGRADVATTGELRAFTIDLCGTRRAGALRGRPGRL